MVWGAEPDVRRTLHQEFPVRISVKCRCGRSYGFLYGNAEQPARYYPGSHIIPFTITGNGSTPFKCHRRCGGDYRVNYDVLKAAYRIAAAKDNKVLVLPYDLQRVPRRQPPVRLDRAFIGR